MNERLSTPIQIEILKKRFEKLNPEIDPSLIDWSGVAGNHENFSETVQDFKNQYPQYEWENDGYNPHFFVATEDVKEQAEQLGLDVIDRGEHTRILNKVHKLENDKIELIRNNHKQKTFTENNKEEPKPETNTVFTEIIDDVFDAPIILVSKRGHGKTTSLATIIKKLKERHPKVIVKAFDVSQAWYHRAPLPHRQRILLREPWKNHDNCVYEIGSLSKDNRRIFVGIIIKQDYQLRYDLKLKQGEDYIKTLPRIVYIFEEANCYFDSYSLRKNDDITPYLLDFISVGRNYGLSAFLVVTSEVGELSPSLRRRSTRLIGQIVNDYDLRMLRRKSKRLGDLVNKMPKYHWVYYNGRVSEVFRIRDEVTNIPQDYTVKIEIAEPQKRQRSTTGKAVIGFIIGATIALLFFMYFAGL